MSMKAWSYEFSCGKSLYEMEPILNEAGPWQWMVRDCAWYPDFLQGYPEKHVRLCIYQIEGGPFFRSLAEIKEESPLDRSALDDILISLLEKLSVENLVEIDPEEWPFD